MWDRSKLWSYDRKIHSKKYHLKSTSIFLNPSARKCEDPVCHAPEALINSLKGMMSSCGNKPSWAKPALAKTAAAAATTVPVPSPTPPIFLASGQSWCNRTEAREKKNKLLSHTKERKTHQKTSFNLKVLCFQKDQDILSLKIVFHFNDKKHPSYLYELKSYGSQNELR